MQSSWTFARISDEGNDGGAFELERFPRGLTRNVALGLLWQEYQSRDTTGYVEVPVRPLGCYLFAASSPVH